MMNQASQHITNDRKDYPKGFLRWVPAIFVFGASLFVIFYFMFVILESFISKSIPLLEKYPLLGKYGIFWAVIPNLIILAVLFAIAAFAAVPFLPKEIRESIGEKLLELWDRISTHVSSSNAN